MHRRRREVRKGPNLILSLELVGVVGARRNGAVCSKDSILPRVLPLLYPIPSNQKRLVEVVDDGENDVVVGRTVEPRPRKLPVNENTLQQ